tara:strand:+ start:376 stop:642 length:267 start_codon:yes stop_codon:yes gene_type:complete
MSLYRAGLAAKSIGYITFAFDKTASLLGKIGRRGYQAVANKPKYSVELMIGERHIEVRDNVTAKQVNDVMKAMDTIDSVSIIVRKFRI